MFIRFYALAIFASSAFAQAWPQTAQDTIAGDEGRARQIGARDP